jgi:S1-C subfamily serine protease
MASTLINLSNELAAIVDVVAPHIVSVRARRHYPSSGVLLSKDAIVTADHTIHRDEDIIVTLPGGTSAAATLVGRDPGTDLAVLKLQTPASPSTQPARAATVKAGELALVIGRSPDSGANASLGIVSAMSGAWRTWRGGQLDAYIRLDARLFPQSSGGAVVNTRGELIGIATSALSRIAGVAIPISTVAGVSEKILQRGFVPRGYFGIGVQQVPFSDDLRKGVSILNRGGLIILSVEPGGPADKAGLLIGDVVTSIGDARIESAEELQNFSDSGVVGTTVNINYVRGGAMKQSPLTVGERPGKRS